MGFGQGDRWFGAVRGNRHRRRHEHRTARRGHPRYAARAGDFAGDAEAWSPALRASWAAGPRTRAACQSVLPILGTVTHEVYILNRLDVYGGRS